MVSIKTPRGTFKITETFENDKAAKKAGYGYYFCNDDGTEIYTKHIDEYHVEFAILRKPYIVTMDEQGFYRLIKYNNSENQYSEVIEKTKAETKMDAKLYFHYKYSIDTNALG